MHARPESIHQHLVQTAPPTIELLISEIEVRFNPIPKAIRFSWPLLRLWPKYRIICQHFLFRIHMSLGHLTLIPPISSLSNGSMNAWAIPDS
ncbi:MAG: hypothetical protein Ct9H90mP16_21900 [Candidatus Poseidoniales archaeon]|nr:MAG: hypothetical protein Ct9H90mP16_21900 [Candidatus Poseidoniales archaeon]